MRPCRWLFVADEVGGGTGGALRLCAATNRLMASAFELLSQPTQSPKPRGTHYSVLIECDEACREGEVGGARFAVRSSVGTDCIQAAGMLARLRMGARIASS